MKFIDMEINNSTQYHNSLRNQMNTNIQTQIRKQIAVWFSTSSGLKNQIFFDNGITVADMIRKYLEKIKKPELYCRQNDLVFLYNEVNIDYNDQRKLKEFFKYDQMPKINVVDILNLIVK